MAIAADGVYRSMSAAGESRRCIPSSAVGRHAETCLARIELLPNGRVMRLSCDAANGPSVRREQPFHIGEDRRRRLRQPLDTADDLSGADRADIDAELAGLFEEARVAVDREKRGL
jgi:hypothetical protein